MRTLLISTALGLALAASALGQAVRDHAGQDQVGQDQAAQVPELVQRALAAELAAARETGHPMRYVLRRSSPRLTTTKEMIETRDGSVAMLVAVNDRALSADEEAKEQERLSGLMADPGRQGRRKQAEDEDTERALKVLRALPDAFVYQHAGQVQCPAGTLERFTFRPNPRFSAQDLETEVLTAMAGEIWVDPAQARVVRLEGHVRQDVDFGWGILGRLHKGGWITIEQEDVGGGVWRIVKLQISMSARVLIKTRSFETNEVVSRLTPVPAGIGYREGIAMLRAQDAGQK